MTLSAPGLQRVVSRLRTNAGNGISTSPWTTIALAVVLAVIGLSAVIYFYQHDSILIYNDAFGHLKIGRFVVRGLQPGAAQLGGVWLPVPHILMLPFIWNDWAFRSGVAGSIGSVAGFVTTGVFIYLITARITRQQLAGLTALVVFAANPNVLYMQSIPMTELPLLAFISGGTYFVIKWGQKPDHLGYLMLAATFAFFASLTRYEGWAFAFLAMILVGYIIAPTKRGSEGGVQAHALTFGLFALYGIPLWLLWNAILFGDPFFFQSGEFSALEINRGIQNFLGAGPPASEGNIFVATSDYLRAAYWNAGLLVTIIAFLGLCVWLLREKLSRAQIGVLLLATPAAMQIFAMYSGDSFLLLPDRDHQLHNIRYGLLLLPLLAVGAGYLSKFHVLAKPAIMCIALVQYALLVGGGDVVTYIDATRGLGGGGVDNQGPVVEQLQPVTDWFGENYDSGLILIDSSANNNVLFSKVPTSSFLHEGVYQTWDAAIEDPAAHVDWIYMQRSGVLPDRVWDNLHDTPKLAEFIKVREVGGVLIYVSRDHYDEWVDSTMDDLPPTAAVSSPRTPQP